MISNIEVDVLVNGKPIRKYTHDDKVFVESKHWVEYAIRIRNTSWSRRLAVVTVDGINVINGEAGASSNAGYVINGYGSVEIKGFRTSNDVVHPFKFNRQERSYAAKADATGGDTSNCGVIGVEVFTEKDYQPAGQTYTLIPPYIPRKEPVYRWHDNIIWCNALNSDQSYSITCDAGGSLNSTGAARGVTSSLHYLAGSNSLKSNGLSRSTSENEEKIMSFCASQAYEEPQKRGFDMGTEFSEHEVVDKVKDVEFEIGYSLGIATIYYASYEGLNSMGVPMTRQTQISVPNPFPSKFCKPPRR